MYRLQQHEITLLSQIIDRFNRGDDAVNLRQAIAEDVLRLLDADFLASFVWNEKRKRFEDAASLNMSADNLARYEAYYQFHDPITPLLQVHKSATLVAQVMPQAELMRTEFYNDFLRRDGLYTGINLYAYDGEHNIGDLRIWRGRRRREMGAREVFLVDLLRPHFTNALRNVRSLHQECSRAVGWQELWEGHPNPCFVFDAEGREVHRNRSARALARSLSAGAHADLVGFLGKVRRDNAAGAMWGGYRQTMVHSGANCDHGAAGLTLLQLVPAQRQIVDRRWLQSTFGLTERESAVCLLAVKGLSDKQIATALAISFWTVRTHLDHAYRKCHASSRAELMHALLGNLVRFDT